MGVENEFTYIDEVYRLSEEESDLSIKIQKAAMEINHISSNFRAENNKLREITSKEYFSLEEAKKLHELVTKYRSEVLQKSSFIYLKLQENGVREKLMEWDENYSDLLSDEIWVAISNEKIYAKTPRINKTFNHTAIRKGAAYTKNYYSFFAPEVKRKLGMMMDKIPSFGRRNVNVLAVYNNPRDNMPDTLNLDIKTIIDALTCFLPGGDEATICSFSMASVASTFLPEGTYFTVENGFSIAPRLEENMMALKKVFRDKIV